MYNQPYQYQNPYQIQQTPQHKEVTRVHGRQGAEMCQLGPNSSDLYLDETAPLVWLKVTDGAGYPTLTPYKIEPYEPEKPADYKSLEERISKIEEVLKDVPSKSNAVKADERNGQSKQSRHD